jgi:predicted permease
MERIWTDLRYALRSLTMSPQFTVPAVLGLAVGLSIATLMFSAVNAFLFRPLPVRGGGNLVALAAQKPTSGGIRNLSYLNLVDIRDDLRSLDGVIAYSPINPSFRAGDFSDRLFGQVVTGNYFESLGIGAASGRTLRSADDTAAAPPAIVISHALWINRFQSNPAAVGSAIFLNGTAFDVVGVAREGFHGIDSLLRADFWVAAAHAERAGGTTGTRDTNMFRIRASVRPGTTVAQAQAELDVLSTRLQERYPVENAGLRISLVPETRTRPTIDMRDRMPVVGALLMGLALMVLLNTCANVTGLTLARSVGGQRDVSLRLALGASTRRVVSQVVLENVLIALAAGVAGFVVVRWGAAVLSATVALNPPYHIDIEPNLLVFAFTLALAALAGVAVALAPALSAVRTDLRAMLHYGQGATEDRRRTRARGRAVMTQFALVTVLLTTAILFTRSASNAKTADLGFATDNRLLFTLAPGDNGYDAERGRRIIEDLLTQVRGIPGIRAASIVHDVPLGPSSSSIEVRPADQSTADAARTSYTIVDADYFAVTAIPLLAGRSFDERDSAAAPRVAVVNELLARRFWPGENAVGKQLRLARDADDTRFEIVGVVRNATYNSLFETPRGYIYLPYSQNYRSEMTFVLHSQSDPTSLVRPVEQRLQEIDRSMALYAITTFDAAVDTNGLGTTRVGAGLLLTFGGLGGLMAVLGMYGLLSYLTQLQRREIGIRMAVGATAAMVIAFLMRRGMRLALPGIAVGFVLAAGVAILIRSFMFGVGSIDFLTSAIVPAVLAAVALLAGYLPARRIVATNPIAALGRE